MWAMKRRNLMVATTSVEKMPSPKWRRKSAGTVLGAGAAMTEARHDRGPPCPACSKKKACCEVESPIRESGGLDRGWKGSWQSRHRRHPSTTRYSPVQSSNLIKPAVIGH